MDTTPPRSAGIVLAAGGSSRMGRPKQLLPLDGRPLLERAVTAANDSRLGQVVVVLGANAEAIRESIVWGRARVVVNPDHAQGMSTSLQAGIRALDESVARCVAILGDQPSLSAALLDVLLDVHAASGLPAAALHAGGVLQPPAVLSRALWPDVLALHGDVGLRDVLRAHPEQVATVVPPVDLVDVDTPEDYARLSSSTLSPPAS